MSAPGERLWQHIKSLLYPTTTYHYNSGGEPRDIPKLTHEGLVAFHRAHYHPSEAIFLTYGDIPAEEHQARFEEWALGRFSARPRTFAIGDERRYTAPVSLEAVYPLNPGEDTAGRTHILLGWLLGPAGEKACWLEAKLLAGVLLNNSASPLLHYLETTPLASAPAEHCGLDDGSREMGFYCGVEGSDPEHATALEAEVLACLARVADEGLPFDQVEPVLMQMELAQRDIGGGSYPYGLQLLGRAMSAEFYGGDPAEYLDLDADFVAMRQRIQAPDYLPGLVRRLLLDNPHRARVVMCPDPEEGARLAAAEIAELAALATHLDAPARAAIQAKASALAQRQAAEDDPTCLPKVGREDIPADLAIPQGREAPVGRWPATWYDVGTNGIVHAQVVLDLPALDPEEEEWLPHLVSVWAEVGCNERDYLAQQMKVAATGVLRASYSMRGEVSAPETARGYVVLAAKGLRDYHGRLAALLAETLAGPRLDEGERIRDLMAQARVGAEAAVTDMGHSLALAAATSGMGGMGRLNQLWDGPLGVQRLKALDDGLDEPARLEHLLACFQRLHDKLRRAPRRLLVVAEGAEHPALAAELDATWVTGATGAGAAAGAGAASGAPYAASGGYVPVRQGWIANTQVNFCAMAYPAVASDHADAPIFAVLGRYLQEGFLHREIRERGGAYGSGAGYDPDTGTFRFHSYRDPRLAETLAAFTASLDWLAGSRDPRRLEEAILGVIRGIDQPRSPAGEAVRAYYDALQGRTAEFRRRFRARVLEVEEADLRRVAERYLTPEHQSIGVVASPTAMQAAAGALGLAVATI